MGKEKELPKYIKDKIIRQNEYVFRAQALEREIEAWCKKVGIDTDSKEFYEVRSFEDGVSPLSDYVIEKLYKSNKI